jgi:(p)ppGpp synthase/HD superfamily hydrolase
MDSVKASLKDAVDFARERHHGQLDDEGKNYFTAHCCQVAEIVKLVAPDDLELLQAAYLHDTLEDTETTSSELAQLFGQRVSRLVLEVTHEGKKDDIGYYFPRLKSRDAIILKYCDRVSNLSRMSVWSRERQSQYIKKSKFWKSSRSEV